MFYTCMFCLHIWCNMNILCFNLTVRCILSTHSVVFLQFFHSVSQRITANTTIPNTRCSAKKPPVDNSARFLEPLINDKCSVSDSKYNHCRLMRLSLLHIDPWACQCSSSVRTHSDILLFGVLAQETAVCFPCETNSLPPSFFIIITMATDVPVIVRKYWF